MVAFKVVLVAHSDNRTLETCGDDFAIVNCIELGFAVEVDKFHNIPFFLICFIYITARRGFLICDDKKKNRLKFILIHISIQPENQLSIREGLWHKNSPTSSAGEKKEI